MQSIAGTLPRPGRGGRGAAALPGAEKPLGMEKPPLASASALASAMRAVRSAPPGGMPSLTRGRTQEDPSPRTRERRSCDRDAGGRLRGRAWGRDPPASGSSRTLSPHKREDRDRTRRLLPPSSRSRERNETRRRLRPE